MDKEKTTSLEKSEFEDIFKSIKVDVRLSRGIFFLFIVVALFFRIYLSVSISFIIPGILFVWIFFDFIIEYFLDRAKNIEGIQSIYIKSLIGQLLFLTVIIHFLGSIEWIGGIFYVLIISLATIILPKRKTGILIITATIFYLSLVLLEFFEIIPHRTLFPEQATANLYLNPVYVAITSIAMVAFLFFSADMVSSFAAILREKREKLVEAEKVASDAFKKEEEAKKVLEIRVKARTKELESLTKTLESQVQDRTRELEKKLKELEKTNKLMVGRELKMIELKKELGKAQETEKAN